MWVSFFSVCSYTDPPPTLFSSLLLENAAAKEYVLWRYSQCAHHAGGGATAGKLYWWWCDMTGSPPPPVALVAATAVPCSALTRTKSPARNNWKQMLIVLQTPSISIGRCKRGKLTQPLLTVHQPFCLVQGKHESQNCSLPKFYRFISPPAPHLANQDC